MHKLPALDFRQRLVIWVGCALLLLLVLYPEFETDYYAEANVRRIVGRHFILNGMLLLPSGHSQVENRITQTIRVGDIDGAQSLMIDAVRKGTIRESNLEQAVKRANVRIQIKFWNVAVQSGSVLLLMFGGIWAVGPSARIGARSVVAKGRGASPTPDPGTQAGTGSQEKDRRTPTS